MSDRDRPAGVENTAKRESVEHAGGFIAFGSTRYIEGMEEAGQRQLLESTVIPTRMLHGCTEQTLLDLGFELGPEVDGDPLFREARLPAGWSRQSGEHTMWSYLVDGSGKRRVAMFYKAAYYDRGAHLSIAQAEE